MLDDISMTGTDIAISPVHDDSTVITTDITTVTTAHSPVVVATDIQMSVTGESDAVICAHTIVEPEVSPCLGLQDCAESPAIELITQDILV